jgi:hypothetical protein
VEWVALALLVALALGAAVALAPRVEGRSLGAALAHRMRCTAAGGCPDRLDTLGPYRDPNRPVDGFTGHGRQKRPVDGRVGRSGVAALGVPVARRVAGALVKRAWIACIGYRRYRYERAHPERLSPFDAMPLGEAAGIANKCLNPYGFLAAP